MTSLTALYTFLSVIILLAAVVYLKLIRRSKRLYDTYRAQGVPGEPFVPLIGQIKDYQRAEKDSDGVTYFQELTNKHGHRFLFGYGPFTRLFCSEPELLADVLGRAQANNFRKPTDFTGVLKPIIGDRNLLLMEGSEHDRARKMLTSAFHFAQLQSMIPIMVKETAEVMETFFSRDETKVIDLKVKFSSLTLSIIAASAFGQDFKEIPDAKEIICRAFTEVLDAISYRTVRMIDKIPFLSMLPFWRKAVVADGAKRISDFVDTVITNRRQGQSASLCPNGDLLGMDARQALFFHSAFI